MHSVPFYDLGAAVRERRALLHDRLDAVIDAGYFVGGTAVSGFEREFADYVGAGECVGVGNGLDGLRIGMEALGIGPGDEVIVPGFTFYATWLAVMQTGATPVPVDVRLETASLDTESVAGAITPKTKAILVVHLYGIPADLAALRQLADDSGVFLVEDAAQSHGARSGDAMTGSVGDFSAFSFYPTKNLGALGDGGAIVTNSAELAAVARRRRSYGQGPSKYQHIDTGWNSRLDTLQAAFLSDGLQRLDAQNRSRRETAATYLEALGSASDSVVGSQNALTSVWHHFVLRVSDREAAQRHFEEFGVGTDVHYPYFFNSVEPLRRYATSASLSHSHRLADEVLSFPISPLLTDDDVAHVAVALARMPRVLVAAG